MLRTSVSVSAMSILLVAVLYGERASPHRTETATVGGATITIDYGRPFMKTRKVFGGLVPYGQIWRTGSDEATTLRTDKELRFGDVPIPIGSVGLWTIPDEKQWKLAINKKFLTWGSEYDPAQDIGRADMTVEPLANLVEQFTISVKSSSSGVGVLTMDWERTRATATFQVKK